MFVLSSKAAVFYAIKKGEYVEVQKYRSIVRNMRMISPAVNCQFKLFFIISAIR